MAALYARIPSFDMSAGMFALLDERDGVCATGLHNCLDINATGTCCDDYDYCYFDSSFAPRCCTVGSNCNNPCSDIQLYLCDATITTTSTISSGTITALSTITTTSEGCCSRGCDASSAYECAASFGGQCCSYGFSCASSGQCVSTATSSSAVVTESVAGCSSGQFSCASSIGGGCCSIGASCLVESGTPYCAAGTSSSMAAGSTITGLTKTSAQSNGLSVGAKAGIGVGVSLIACILVGACTWFCMARRRRRRSQSASQIGASQTASQTGSQHYSRRPGARPTNSNTGQSMSQTSIYPRTQTSIRGAAPQLDAVPGPYSSNDGPDIPIINRMSTRGAVPVGQPQGPGDIRNPVEIEGTEIPRPGMVSRTHEQKDDVKSELGNDRYELPAD